MAGLTVSPSASLTPWAASAQKEKKRCISEFRAELESGLNRDARFLTFAEYADELQKERESGIRLTSTGERVAAFRALLDASTPRPSLVGFRLCLFAGLRRGEACALTWSDFDAEKGTATIDKSLCTETLKAKTTKTEAMRTLPLDPAAAAYLVRFHKIQAKKLIALGKPVGEHRIVAKAQCESMHPENLTRSLARLGKANGFEGITPHLLRHTYCTLLCETGQGVKTAQNLMGHTDPLTTLRIYGHYQEENGLKAPPRA